MHFADLRQPLVILAGILALLLAALPHSIAKGDTSTLSGRVVNMAGQPIAEFRLAIQPIDVIDGEMWMPTVPLQQSSTDSAGHFRISGIVPGRAQFVALPEPQAFAPDTEIHSIDIGGLSFLPIDSPNLKMKGNVPFPVGFGHVDLEKLSTVGGIPFDIKSGVDIKDITIKVRPRMRIRGRVLAADGTPLVNASGRCDLHYRSLDGVNSGNFSVTPTYTDSDGYFVKYVNLPIFCTVSVEYRGGMATSETFKIAEGQRRHDLVFRLSDALIPERVQAPPVPPPPVPPMPEPIQAWVVNPTNGHAYKKIRCKNWADARATAIAEGAHLVSINDEAEQKWLVEIFGQEPFWIGLTRLANQTEWQWTSGEPVTYTNWVLRGFDVGANDVVFVGITNGKWHLGRPESSRRIGIAIIEKEDVRPDKPLEDR